MNLHKAIFLLLFTLLCQGLVSGQDTARIQVSYATEGPYFNTLPSKSAKSFDINEISHLRLSFLGLDSEKEFTSVFVSDAEIQELVIAGQKFYAGKYQNVQSLSNKWDYRHFIIPTKLLIAESAYVKCYNLTVQKFSIAPTAFASETLEQGIVEIIASSKTGIIFTIFFLGGIFIFLVYTIGLTVQTKNDDFRYYAYYLGAILVHNIIQADAFLKVFAFFPKSPIWYHNLNEFLQMFIYAFFMLFIKVFLELPKENKWMDKFVNRSIIATICFGFVFLGTALFTKNFVFLQNYLSILWLIVAALGAIIVIGVYRKSNNPIRYYIMAGSIFLLIGSILELYSSLSLVGGYNWNLYATPENAWYPFNYTQLAILGEIICFALGIGYKIRKKEKLLFDFQQKEIIDLQQETLKKDSEIKSLAVSIASEQSMRAEANQLLELLETQYGLIQYQLNPHFLFNNLNAINNLVMYEKHKEASKYLVDFSKLLRKTINKSKNHSSKITEEIAFINDYLSLEKERLNDAFEYDIKIDPAIEFDNIDIPSFILQPFLEHCIWNHLLSKENDKKMLLSFTKLENAIKIDIEDNGIAPDSSVREKFENISSHFANRVQLIYEAFELNNLNQILFKREGERNLLSIQLPLNVNPELVHLLKSN